MVRILLLGFCKVEYVQFFKIYFSQEKIQDASDPCLSPVYCCLDCFCKNGIQKNIMESNLSQNNIGTSPDDSLKELNRFEFQIRNSGLELYWNTLRKPRICRKYHIMLYRVHLLTSGFSGDGQ
jgi:hypothetical protein